MPLEQTLRFLEDASIGLFGAGHLARAIAVGLLDAGLPRSSLAICHRASEQTHQQLVLAGLSDLIAESQQVVRRSRILFYLVRPQDHAAIGDYRVRNDSLFVSFLAGVRLESIPVHLPATRRVRVMSSAPDSLRQRKGIAALAPSVSPLIREVMESLGLHILALRSEDDIHAFTALGPCLPIVLTYWEGLGNSVDDSELLDTANRFSLPDYAAILHWAHVIRPRNLSKDERPFGRFPVEAAREPAVDLQRLNLPP
jgi:pyrroline-5-carboxylate reductase